jgi:hypothetical protein
VTRIIVRNEASWQIVRPVAPATSHRMSEIAGRTGMESELALALKMASWEDHYGTMVHTESVQHSHVAPIFPIKKQAQQQHC